MSDQEFLEKLKKLSAEKKSEVEDFADFLLHKAEQQMGENKGNSKIRKAGFAKGTFIVHPGFDDPIEGMEEYIK